MFVLKGETIMETKQTTNQEKKRAGRPRGSVRRLRVATALRITPEEYGRMRERARLEGLSFASWLVRMAFKELRRPLL
jgi:hypothetical protein